MEKLFSVQQTEFDFEPLSESEIARDCEQIKKVITNIDTVIRGKHDQVCLVVLCMLAEGNVLIEDIPGVGKTSLVSSLAKTIDCEYKRIQFTPDVMPSDVSGFSIYNQKTGEFEFRRGAAMSNIVLADEINRASAKTQSAMLEIMEEKQVTVDGNTYKLKRPFMVLATQNPIDQLGTYQLPEAQIDRFMVKLSLGYPNFEDEVNVVMLGRQAKAAIDSVVNADVINQLIADCHRVSVSRVVSSYIVHIVEATRSNADIRLGASPRGSINLHALSRAYALLQGRNYVIPDDVKVLAPYVLSHRIILSQQAKNEKKDPAQLIRGIVGQVVVPTTTQNR